MIEEGLVQGLPSAFRERATKHALQGYLSLFAVALLLVSAVAIFFYARAISAEDIKATGVLTRTDALEKQIKELLEEVGSPNPVDVPEEVIAQHETIVAQFKETRDRLGNILTLIDRNVISTRRFELDLPEEGFDTTQTKAAAAVEAAKTYESEEAAEQKVEAELAYNVFGKYELSNLFRNLPPAIELTFDEIGIFGSGAAVIAVLAKPTQDTRLFHELASDEYYDDLAQYVQKLIELQSNSIAIREPYLRAGSRSTDNWMKKHAIKLSRITALEKTFDTVLEAEISENFINAGRREPTMETSWPLLIQTNITRFGPMIIIFFFVSILVNLYRYNVRLSAYYNARADALILMGDNYDSAMLERLVTALSPDLLDIGKPPKLPTEYVFELAKTAVEKTSPFKRV